MNIFKYIFIGVITISIAYFTLCLFTPSRVVLSQATIINAPIDSVYHTVADLNSWKKWHPWFRKMNIENFSIDVDPDSGLNRISWQGRENTGGRIAITGYTVNTSIQTSLTYQKENYSKVNQGEFLFTRSGNSTKISWILIGTEYPFFLKPSTIILKGIFTKNYENGLKNLKALCEGRPLPKKSRMDEQ